MLLHSFAILSAFGTGLWLLGHYFEFHGVAAIGAVIVIAIGGAATLTPLTVKSGEQIDRDFATINNQTVNNQTNISYTYQTVAVTQSIGSLQSYLLGALTMIAGALLLVQDLNQIEV